MICFIVLEHPTLSVLSRISSCIFFHCPINLTSLFLRAASLQSLIKSWFYQLGNRIWVVLWWNSLKTFKNWCLCDSKTDCVSLCLFSQSASHNFGAVSRILPALLWLLFLQRAALSAAASPHLLGLSHPAHGLQVCVPWQGKKSIETKRQEGQREQSHCY